MFTTLFTTLFTIILTIMLTTLFTIMFTNVNFPKHAELFYNFFLKMKTIYF